MAEGSLAERWVAYRPSKPLWFWSCVASAILTMVVGFAWGGWTTAGTAQKMAATAADDARAQLVADVCVQKFMKGPEFASQLVALKDANSWKRSDMIEEKGWVTLAGMKEPLSAAAGICANKLVTMTPTSAANPKVEKTSTSGS